MTLTQSIGDTKSHSIALVWEGAAFVPGTDWGLIFTAKVHENDADADALIQKASGAGLSVSGSTATIEIVPADTVDLAASLLVCDIQAQHLTTGAVRTFDGIFLRLKRDKTRATTTSIPIYTTQPPIPGGSSTWGGITGTLSDQTDLQAALDAISSAGVPDGNKGSLTVSGSSWTINTGAVTNDMLAGSIALSKLLTDPLARANHTGTQAHTTITGLGTLATQSGTFSGTSSGTNTGDQDLSGYALKATPTDLAATTALVPGSVYYHTSLTNRTFTFSTPLTSGESIRIEFLCSAEITLTFPPSYRVGDDPGTVTTITFPAGNHAIKWEKIGTIQKVSDSAWTDTAGDTTEPTVSTLSPVDGATDVAIGSNLVVTFSESIAAGTGNVTIKNLTDATQSTIAIGDGQCVISGSTLTINPTSDLANSKSYAIQIAATCIDDLAGNSFAGILNDTTWNFATAAAADVTAPTISTLSPTDNATDVAIGSNLVATFSENIEFGIGAITLRKNDGGWTDVEVFDVEADVGTGPGQVSISGAVLTINPTADLIAGTEYSVRIESTAIADTSVEENLFAGISNDTTWSFTTAAAGISDPTEIANLALWLDASDTTKRYDATTGGSLVTADNTDVLRLEDKSGNSRHATQGTATKYPKLQTAVQNSLDVLEFDGSNDVLTTTGFAGTQACTMFAVCAIRRQTGANAIVGWAQDYQTPNPGANAIVVDTGKTNWFQNGLNSTTKLSSYTATVANMANDEFAILAVVQDGTHAGNDLWKNNAQPTATAGFSGEPGTLTKASTAVGIGAYNATANPAQCYIGEVIIYNATLSQSDREAVQTYLATKWGITLS